MEQEATFFTTLSISGKFPTAQSEIGVTFDSYFATHQGSDRVTCFLHEVAVGRGNGFQFWRGSDRQNETIV